MKALLIFVAVALGIYRILVLRKSNVGTLKALGFTLDRKSVADLVTGICIGMLAIAAILVLEVTSGISNVTSVGPLAVLARDWATWIMVPAIEELVFRSALLGGLLIVFKRSPWIAIVLSAVVFGGAHALNAHATVLTVLGTSIHGVVYGAAFALTSRVWLPIGLHFGWNYAQGPLLGFPLSGGLVKQGSFVHLARSGSTILTGGSYGPEGGLVSFAGDAILVLLVAIYLMRRRGGGISNFTFADSYLSA